MICYHFLSICYTWPLNYQAKEYFLLSKCFKIQSLFHKLLNQYYAYNYLNAFVIVIPNMIINKFQNVYMFDNVCGILDLSSVQALEVVKNFGVTSMSLITK